MEQNDILGLPEQSEFSKSQKCIISWTRQRFFKFGLNEPGQCLNDISEYHFF